MAPRSVDNITDLNARWMYDGIGNMWAEFLGSDATESFKRNGCYHKMLTPKVKLIALNNNVCQRMNFWNVYDPVDPDGQLKWFIEQLQEAEKVKHNVIVITHIPPGNGCTRSWTHNYYRILDRFSSSIVGQYYGHTHKDELVLFAIEDANNNTHTVGSGFCAPSLTPAAKLNPAYRIITLNQAVSTGIIF